MEINEEAILESLKSMQYKQVERLDDSTKKLFYAIMKIADQRDEALAKVKFLNKQNEELYEKYCQLLKEKNNDREV